MRRSILILLLLTDIAAADTRYQIHPTNGAFVTTSRGCGSKTKDELATRVLAFVPTLTVDAKQVMTLLIKNDRYPADEMVEGIGWWHFDGKASTKTMVISLEPATRDGKIITISVIRRMDDLECTERWIGIVKERVKER